MQGGWEQFRKSEIGKEENNCLEKGLMSCAKGFGLLKDGKSGQSSKETSNLICVLQTSLEA